jgi:DNA-binding ferritin-like protein (Dps family)
MVNWDTPRLEYFAPVKRLPEIYEVAYKGLKRYMYIRKTINFPFTDTYFR